MGLVKLVRGRQFQYQNVFRTISFGYMPFLPMSQSYKMELDGEFASMTATPGASPAGYWSLGPQEEYKKNPKEGAYPWMIRRFAYNQGGSGRLSSLNSYNRQEMALNNTPDNFMKTEARAMGLELQKLIAGANAVGERQYEEHDIAELEMRMLGDLLKTPVEGWGVGGNPLVLKPNQYRKAMGITDDTFKQLSSQSFDFVFDKHPGVEQLTMGLLGEAGGVEAVAAAKGAVGLEMTAGAPTNKFLVANLKSIFKDSADAQAKTEASVATQITKINALLEAQILKSPMVLKGTKPSELAGAPDLFYGGTVQQLFHKHPNPRLASLGQLTLSLAEARAGTPGWVSEIGPEDIMSTYHWLYTKIKKEGSSKLQDEARRILSRAGDMVNYQLMKQTARQLSPKGGNKWIEHLNLGGGYQGLVILETFMKTIAGTVGLGKVPQLQSLGVYVLAAESLADAARRWAKASLFAKVKGIDAVFKKLHQQAIDESTKTKARIDLAGTAITVESIEKMLGGVQLYVGDAGGYAGVVGLTTTSMAEGIELQLKRLFSSSQFQGKFAAFYNEMMDGSNRLSTQWKKRVPMGTTSDALISQEWTFGDGRQRTPPGGPRKHFLGLWGPTGNAAGKYINWRDNQRRLGGNISISPFLTSRRAGVGQAELFGQ